MILHTCPNRIQRQPAGNARLPSCILRTTPSLKWVEPRRLRMLPWAEHSTQTLRALQLPFVIARPAGTTRDLYRSNQHSGGQVAQFKTHRIKFVCLSGRKARVDVNPLPDGGRASSVFKFLCTAQNLFGVG